MKKISPQLLAISKCILSCNLSNYRRNRIHENSMIHFGFTLVFILTISVNRINAQNTSDKYLATYLEKRITSESELEKLKSFPKAIKDRVLNQINTGEEKFLFLDKHLSFFSLKENLKTTQTDVGMSLLGGETERTTHLTTTEYYKSLNDTSLIITKNIKENTYVIKEDLHPFKWKLMDDSKLMKSMNCKKATTIDDDGNKIEAWYTEEIPISNGPSIYGGLPGLIIELKTKNKTFYLQHIENVDTTYEINFPSTDNAITMKDFKKLFSSK